MLSTIILNWNRAYLLHQCVDSYLETVAGDFELMIVDNASTDGSRDYCGGSKTGGRCGWSISTRTSAARRSTSSSR